MNYVLYYVSTGFSEGDIGVLYEIFGKFKRSAKQAIIRDAAKSFLVQCPNFLTRVFQDVCSPSEKNISFHLYVSGLYTICTIRRKQKAFGMSTQLIFSKYC